MFGILRQLNHSAEYIEQHHASRVLDKCLPNCGDHYLACNNCRSKKVRCTAQRSGCDRCKAAGLNCTYSSRNRTRSSNNSKINPKSMGSGAPSPIQVAVSRPTEIFGEEPPVVATSGPMPLSPSFGAGSTPKMNMDQYLNLPNQMLQDMIPEEINLDTVTVDEMMKQSSRPTPTENIDLELIDLPTSETTSDSLFNLDDDLSHSGSSLWASALTPPRPESQRQFKDNPTPPPQPPKEQCYGQTRRAGQRHSGSEVFDATFLDSCACMKTITTILERLGEMIHSNRYQSVDAIMEVHRRVVGWCRVPVQCALCTKRAENMMLLAVICEKLANLCEQAAQIYNLQEEGWSSSPDQNSSLQRQSQTHALRSPNPEPSESRLFLIDHPQPLAQSTLYLGNYRVETQEDYMYLMRLTLVLQLRNLSRLITRIKTVTSSSLKKAPFFMLQAAEGRLKMVSAVLNGDNNPGLNPRTGVNSTVNEQQPTRRRRREE